MSALPSRSSISHSFLPQAFQGQHFRNFEIALSGVSAKVKPLSRRFHPSRKRVKTSGDVIRSNSNSASKRSTLDLGRTGFAGRRHYERCHRLQRQVLARTRRPLLGVFRRSCDSSDIGLLIEERVVITKVRTVHLSVKIHLPKTRPPSPAIHANRLD